MAFGFLLARPLSVGFQCKIDPWAFYGFESRSLDQHRVCLLPGIIPSALLYSKGNRQLWNLAMCRQN